MKPQSMHAHEDRLLDFAYGELPASEARAMEAHLQGCTRCTEALDGIRGVRATMSRLSLESAPDAGLESLLAYAQQAARHSAEGPVPVRGRWRRWLMPAVGLATVSFLGIISLEVAKSLDLSPSLTQVAPEAAVAQKAEARAYEQAKAAVPAPATAAPAPQAPVQTLEESLADSRTASDKPARERKKDLASASNRGARADWSNSGSAGGFPELRSKYKSRDDEGASSVGGVQAIPPTPAARAELEPAAAPPAQAQELALPPPPPAESAPSGDAMSPAGLAAEADLQAEDEAPVAKAQAPEPAPQRSSLRIGGSSSSGRGAGAAPSMGAVATGSLEAAPSAPSQLGTARPAATAAPSKSALAASEDEAFDAPVPAKKAARKERAAGPSASQLSQRASEAYRAGDRALEASLLRQALASGASGRERLGLLIRLCDAEFALGRRDSAIEACGRVLSEDPGSGAAQVARKRLSRESDDTGRASPAAPAEAQPASTPAPVKR